MRHTKIKLVVASLALAVTAACGGNAGSDDEGADVKVDENAASSFDDGTYMKELADKGTINVGVKYDQPGTGFMGATDDMASGFDPEMGKILAASLGIAPEDITWKETISDNREPFLESGEVDLVIATYSITPERQQIVGQAGPYYVTGQQLLVAEDSDIQSVDDIKGESVCSVTGSTSLETVEAKGAKPKGFDTYSECRDQVLNGSIDVMTTDGAILQGYAAQDPDELEVVGDEFSTEKYGVGYSKDAPEMCQWIVDTLTQAQEDGLWADAFEATLGPAGIDTPEPPAMEPCK